MTRMTDTGVASSAQPAAVAAPPRAMALEECIRQIETDGYCLLPQVYTPQQVARTLNLAKEWYERTKERLTANLPALAKNDPFLWNPQNKDPYFLEVLFGPAIIQQILTHFLNDPWFKQIPPDQPNYILRSFLARSSSEVLPMHIDSLVPYAGPHVFVMQVSIPLEDQTRENGCTMVVPGSHKSGAYAEQSAFSVAVPVESKAGDVVIWDSRIWHGTRENRSQGTRWALITTFTRWWIKQMFNITRTLPQETYARLTDAQKAVLGFCALPFDDETQGVDMKRGYASLLPDVSGYRQ